MKKKKISFDDYYSELFPDRWDGLRRALCTQTLPQPFSTGLLKPYYLDEASIRAAQVLGPIGNGTALDLCAAPGGKTLVLASSLGPQGRIVANERSADRRRRLHSVIKEHLPGEIQDRISITGHDAARWGLHEQNMYDFVLLDAPCSSERHLLENPKYLDLWSPARTRHLAQQSYAMLLSALKAVKKGGRVLYSTCALSPLENDDVVQRAMKRLPSVFKVIDGESSFGEATLYGQNIWPDKTGGMGPIYYSLLEKVEA